MDACWLSATAKDALHVTRLGLDFRTNDSHLHRAAGYGNRGSDEAAFQRRRLKRIAHQCIGQRQRFVVQRPGRGDAKAAEAEPAAILPGRLLARLLDGDDAHDTASLLTW